MRNASLDPDRAKNEDEKIAVIEQIYDSPNLDQRETRLSFQIPFLVRLAKLGLDLSKRTDSNGFRHSNKIVTMLADRCHEAAQKLMAESFHPQPMIDREAALREAADVIQRESAAIGQHRADNTKRIQAAYGLPGTGWSTQDGEKMLLDVVTRLGFAALSDEGVAALARMQGDLAKQA